MSVNELQAKIKDLIHTDDKSYLRAILAFAESKKIENEEAIISYDFKGKSLTRKDYVSNNEEAIGSFKKGDYKTHDQIKKQFTK